MFKQQNKTITYGELERHLEETRRTANRMSFPKLPEAVGSGLRERLQFADEFRSLQKVRNCLEHRMGIVGTLDVNDGADGLRLSLPRLKVFYEDEAGNEVELKAGDRFEKDTMIKMRLARLEKLFRIGERVTFDGSEFKEIALGCWFFADDLSRKLPTTMEAAAAPQREASSPAME